MTHKLAELLWWDEVVLPNSLIKSCRADSPFEWIFNSKERMLHKGKQQLRDTIGVKMGKQGTLRGIKIRNAPNIVHSWMAPAT